MWQVGSADCWCGGTRGGTRARGSFRMRGCIGNMGSTGLRALERGDFVGLA